MAPELRFVGNPDAARDARFVEQVKAALHLPADAHLELQGVTQDARGARVVEYAAPAMKIEGAEFGAVNGVIVDERVRVVLRFDKRGALVASQVSPVDERRVRLVKDQIKKLVAADQIYIPSPGEKVNLNAPSARQKPWYVETDAQGYKRLRRARMA